MAVVPDYVIVIVVGAILLEGFALVALTYLMWKATEKAKEALMRGDVLIDGEEVSDLEELE